MTHSVGRQSGAPFVSGPGATNNVTTTFTQDLTIGAKATPTLTLSSTTTTIGTLVSTSVTDTGSNPITAFVSRIGASTATTTRPTHGWYDASNLILSLLPLNSGANGALSWGTQAVAAPSFTTRSEGTRAVWYSQIGASDTDYADGMETNARWSSVRQASSAYSFKWYGGVTNIAKLSGDGKLDIRRDQTAATTLGASRILDLVNTHGNSGERVEQGFGYTASATSYAPVVIGHLITSSAAHTKGSWYVATRDATTDSAPTERLTVTASGETGFGKTPTAGVQIDSNGPIGHKSYTVGTMPSASIQAGISIYVSNAAGSPCIALSDGTNWKRCDDCTVTVS